MQKIKQANRPFVIRYERVGGRCLMDSAASIEAAMERITLRLSKRENRSERASVYRNGIIVHQVTVTQ